MIKTSITSTEMPLTNYPKWQEKIPSSDILQLRVKDAYQRLPTAFITALLIGLTLCVALWNHIDRTQIVIWYCWLLISYGIRLAIFWRYNNPTVQQLRPQQSWSNYYVLGALASGVAWGGSCALIFHHESAIYQMLIAFTIGGVVAGNTAYSSMLEKSFISFSLPAMLPAILALIIHGNNDATFTMAFMLSIFLLMMTISSLYFNRKLEDAIVLRLQLVASIEKSNQLAQLALLDELTGIANRRMFDQMLATEWQRAQRAEQPLSLILADIDFFKRYNDRLGHIAGDRCLQQVAQVMQDTLNRPADLIARFGGEEFAILLPDTDIMDASMIAERLRQAVLNLQLQHPNSDVAAVVTISLGAVTMDPVKIANATQLIRIADEAMYTAKRQGRNRFAVG